MAREVQPEVFLIAETTSIRKEQQRFLAALGVPTWSTFADSDAEELCEIAGKSCYLSFSTELNKNLTRVGTRSNHEYLQEQIIGARHGSVLEHASMTFAFLNVSRIFTHELVRHRAGAAYSQVSGRYVRADDISYFVPSDIKKSDMARVIFREAFEKMEEWQARLSNLFDVDKQPPGFKKVLTSAFRRLIGNGQGNHIIATFNHRALRNIIELRTSEAAEEEIRIAFLKVLAIVQARYPAIYADVEVTQHPYGDLPTVKFKHSKV